MNLPENSSASGRAPLREKIEEWAAQHAAEYPPEILKLFADKSEDVIKSGLLERTPKVGDKVANFQLRSSSGKLVSLLDKAIYGPVILNFYRGSWCHFCNVEFQMLLEEVSRFQARKASIMAITPQISEMNHVPEEVEAGFVNLSDIGNQVARRFGLVYPLGEAIKTAYENFGIRLDKFNGEESYEVPIPASYILDTNLIIRYAFASSDLTERAEPGELIKHIEAM